MHMLSWILLIIGGLNWGLVGIGGFAGSDWNVVGMLGMTLSNIIFVLVGLSAIYELVTHKKGCKSCGNGGSGAAM
ncbi:DUF378 domain-containing protein [Candidatus Nomurabacteria bacterium]|nr:DUF378 domain-containing protein [Candidatus Nomurabacteria bacterium]